MYESKWYAVELRTVRCATVVREALERYPVPLRLVIPQQRVTEKGKVKEMPILYDYGFVGIASSNGQAGGALHHLHSLKHDVRVLWDKPLSTEEVEWLARITRGGVKAITEKPPSVKPGDVVKIKRGQLREFEGPVVNVRKDTCNIRIGSIIATMRMDAVEVIE